MNIFIRKKLIALLLLMVLLVSTVVLPAAYAADATEDRAPYEDTMDGADPLPFGETDGERQDISSPAEEGDALPDTYAPISEQEHVQPEEIDDDKNGLSPENAQAADNEAEDEELDENTFLIESSEEFKQAFERINGLGSGEFVIKLKSDLSSVGRVRLTAQASVTILGCGHSIDFGCGDGKNNGGICIGSGAVLNLGMAEAGDTLTLTGSIKNDEDKGGLISLGAKRIEGLPNDTACVNMYSGTRIVNVSSKGGLGAAVTLCGENTTFNMYGGEISGCVSDCEDGNAFGGAFCVDKGVLNIYSGLISACRAELSDAEEGAGYGGAVAVLSGTLTILPDEETETVEISSCSADFGGGIYLAPELSSAEISLARLCGNTAYKLGGAVFGSGLDISLDKIYAEDNRAELAGGALCLYQAERVNISASVITGNCSGLGYGGGIAVENCAAVSAAEDNIICGNTAELCAADVYIKNSAAEFAAEPALAAVSLYGLDGSEKTSSWYEDSADARFEAQKLSERKTITSFISADDSYISMVAAQDAVICRVSFELNGHGDAIEVAEVDENCCLTAPTVPAAEGFTFAGWYSDEALSVEYDFSKPVTDNICLYARWTENSYTLSFELGGIGMAIEAQQVMHNARPVMPEEPTDTVCTFGGWYTDAQFVKPFDSESGICADTVLYAKWTVDYTVEHYKEKPDEAGTYLLSETETKTAAVGTTVNATTKYFSGYEADAGIDGSVSFGAVTRDTPLVLKLYYRISDVTVGYELSGGTGAKDVDYDTKTVRTGSSVTLEKAAEKNGFQFKGWRTGSSTYKPGDTVLISCDTTFTAVWESVMPVAETVTPTPRPIPQVTPTPRPIQQWQGGYGGGGIKTGDESNITLWTAILCISACGLAAAAFVMIKKKK